MDERTTVQKLKDLTNKMVRDREWEQFHSPKNLSMDIAVEAAELMEKFMWVDTAAAHDEVKRNRKEVEQELADVVIAACMFANSTNIDISKAVKEKIAEIEEKYPIEKAKGHCTKYTKL